jgi:signal transduction histidine kinase
VLYLIAQEALTNVGKHAQTQSANVTLRLESGYVALEIVDQGAGFEQAAPQAEQSPGSGPGQHLGLVGMRERAALVGGQCTVSSRNGQGTQVEVRIPLRPEPSAMPIPIISVPSGASDHVA